MTADPQTGVREATSAAEREAAAEALALAFLEDPVWRHILPGDESRGEKLLAYFTTEIESLVPDHRELWVSEDGGAAALWGRPGAWRVPLGTTLGEARRMAGVFGRRLPLGLRAQLRLDRRHPRGPGHWYLNYIGVDPRRQGSGLGAALLAPVLERCDREGTPAFLEATSERNAALYGRHGFALTESFPMPGRGGPVLRAMWREPGVTTVRPLRG